MRVDNVADNSGFADKLVCLANWIIRIVGSLIFLGLVWYAFRYTQYMNIGGEAVPVEVQDSMLRNILFLGCVCGGLFGLYRLHDKISPEMQKKISVCSLVLAMLWTAGVGFWWITSVNRIPEGDQAFIYGGASYFLKGNYIYFEKGGYGDICPHQLTLIFLVELLFLIVGIYNYFACQVLGVLVTVGVVYLGYALINKLLGNPLLNVGYCILISCCLPMFFYTWWVYGDVPSAFFVLLAALFLVSYEQKGNWKYLIGVVFAFLMAVLVRKNSLIFLIAFGLTGGFYVLKKKDGKLLAAIILSVLCPVLVTAGINKMYELRSGYEISDGLPASTYVAMGLQENDGVYGWYNCYNREVYYSVDCVPEFADFLAKENIAERLQYMVDNPDYAFTFFKGKILSQWNMPLYESLYFANKYDGEDVPEEGTLTYKINNEYFTKVLTFCDGVQFVIYVGILCYFLFAVKGDSNILYHMMAVGIIGGFFFHIIWEAMARYILPYYLLMYPLAIVGYWNLYLRMESLVGRFRKRQDTDNIIPFKKVA